MNTSRNFGQIKTALSGAVCAGAILALAGPTYAAGTPAGTPIANTASATYDDGSGGTITEDSNTVTIVVDEILDIVVASDDPGDVSVSADQDDAVLTFTVTNGGNGPEDVILTVDPNLGGDNFDPDAVSIYIDQDDNGQYDAGTDTIYDPTNPPTLDPDETLHVFVLGDIPTGVTDGDQSNVELTGTAETGSGAPGTVFAGAGENGSDAVVGSTGAQDNDQGTYAVAQIDIELTKAATVADPFGGTTQVPESIITYTLTSVVSGSGILPNTLIVDAIPAGTTYVAESITLDGAPLTDSDADADAGSFDGTAISVDLGNVAAGTTNIIEFQVEID